MGTDGHTPSVRRLLPISRYKWVDVMLMFSDFLLPRLSHRYKGNIVIIRNM